MNGTYSALPYLKPFDKGLAAFAEKNPEFEFLVTQGTRVNPPRTPRRLLALLEHKLAAKKGRPKFSVGMEIWRPVMHSHSYYMATGSPLMAGPQSGVLRIAHPGGRLEIAFSGLDDTYGAVVKMETDFHPQIIIPPA